LIDVTTQDFLKLYGGLTRMLRALEQAGSAGLPTNEAGRQVFNSRTYGWKILNQASRMGYITREKIPGKTARGGQYYIVNKLTDKGRNLLQNLG
jgi:hypothetical protein